MTIFLVLLIVLGVLFGRTIYIRARRLDRSVKDKNFLVLKKPKGCDMGQCGMSCFCDDEALMHAVKMEPEYFDDKELDTYKGVAANGYNERQINKFSEVLMMLRPEKTAGWLRSLDLRDIALPEPLKDETLIMMEDKK